MAKKKEKDGHDRDHATARRPRLTPGSRPTLVMRGR